MPQPSRFLCVIPQTMRQICESTSALRLERRLPLLLSCRTSGDHALEPDIHDQIAVMVHVIADIGQDRCPTHLWLAPAARNHLHGSLIRHACPDVYAVVIAILERLQNVVATFELLDGALLHGWGLA